ncbi:Nucleotidyl transferase AbiEii toxin, Type IV TA system [Flavobacterium flevense]|uniref:Nucleotidyltransferase n=1 Tax=Flavobacterium flevense TaxID=983 RepID=A0A4Y4AZT7_9FLAO|nr:nucleotidyl transferase AbiEii/AbiGii toxin family protein [Flavobacterium flevense]GEC72134.1 nucleotidyltransferase [Flavobacterium flevense]SHL94196.1 Nucleotidyl transferase AbiEii toxin, Type IV TA system [Flavobacterium flevense]
MTKLSFHALPITEKTTILQQVSNKQGLAPFAVEKDWWVVQTLTTIFEMTVGAHLVFKGGTSLSKAWNLIDRFSEDVDLAIDRQFLGFEGELTKKQITALRKAANSYISETFFIELQNAFTEKGFQNLKWEIIKTTESDQDPVIINLYYPNSIDTPGYIKPRVQIEIGCRSLREPFSTQEIVSLLDIEFPNTIFSQPASIIPTVNPERTFLEKIFLLHEEFSKPKEKIRVERLSRHLYDVYQLSQTKFADAALQNKELYETIVKHRFKFTKVGDIDYNLHQPQTINPIPSTDIIEAWKADYKTMQEQMIYGDSPSFETIISKLTELKTKINNLDWQIEINK